MPDGSASTLARLCVGEADEEDAESLRLREGEEQDEKVENDNWIEANGYSDMTMGELYATSVYFTMQTLTTVGYGDLHPIT